MNTLMKTRCSAGHLIISDTQVIIEKLLGVGTISLNISQITGIELKVTQPDILGLGQAKITFMSTGSKNLDVTQVKLKDAKKAKELVEARLGNSSTGVADLEKLAELKDKGILTQEEFDNKKKQLLGI